MKKQLFNLKPHAYQSGAPGNSIKIEKVNRNDIAIIGMAVKAPMCDDIEDFWNKLKNGVDFISPPPGDRLTDARNYLDFERIDKEKVRFIEAAFLKEIDKFDYGFFKISFKEACLMDPCQRLFLETAWHAIEDSGYSASALKGSKTGIFLGHPLVFDYYEMVRKLAPSLKLMAAPGNISSVIASRLSYIMDLKGPSLLVDTACSSSLAAVHLACQSLRNNECFMAVVGGINLIIQPVVMSNRDIPDIISPGGRAKTFDDSADGTGAGEGSMAVVLKPLTKALHHGDHIHAVIKGSAINQDGTSIGITAPNALAQQNVITTAWEDARITPQSISYIEAHGTGTELGDPIEIEGITRAFGKYTNKKQFCAIGSVKANIGHLDSAAGLAGLIKAVLCLKNKALPPLVHFSKPNSKINFEESPVYVNDRYAHWEPINHTNRRCGVSSFGLSGTNCHVVLEQAPPVNGKDKKDSLKGKWYILTLSAKNQNTLEKIINNYVRFLENKKDPEIADICYTTNTGRDHHHHRLAVLGTGVKDIKKKLKGVIGSPSGVTGSKHVYRGYFQVVPANKPEIKENECSEGQLEELSRQANRVLENRSNQDQLNQQVLGGLAEFYVKGASIKWEKMYPGQQRRRMSLPLYPFEGKRCWLEIPAPAPVSESFFKNHFDPIKEEGMTGGTNSPEIKPKETNHSQQVAVYLKKFVAKAFEMEAGEIDVNADFFELGFDSISIVQIKQEIFQKYGVEISTDQLFGELTNIKKLAESISRTVPREAFPSVAAPPEPSPAAQEASPVTDPGTQVSSQQARESPAIERIFQSQLQVLNRQLDVLQRLNLPGDAAARIETAVKSYPPATTDTESTNQKNQNSFFRRFIVKSDTPLEEKQEAYIKQFIQRFIRRTQKSKQLSQENRTTWANDRFVMGYSQGWKELVYPIMIEKAMGSRIWDVDGNEYIDFSMGFGAILLGYNHPVIAKAIEGYASQGVIIGPITPMAGEVSRLISQLTGVERVAFFNSGTEAMMIAVRIARATTGKDKIVLFAGSFHGTFDGVNALPDYSSGKFKSIPMSLGTPQNLVEDIYVLEYGKSASLEFITAHAHELAAVLVEPVQSRQPQLQPKGFLKQLRGITTESGIVLIFDEIITGFRIHPGGAQAYFGVQADLVAFGKIAGGGLPIGVISGKAKYMDRLDGGDWKYGDDSSPRRDLVVSGGTFSCHPLSMTAAKAVLGYIKSRGDSIYNHLNDRTAKLAVHLNHYFTEVGVPIEVVYFGSLFSFKPKKDVVLLRFLFYHLAEKGIYLWEGATCFLSLAHTDEDIAQLIKAIKDSCDEMASSGCFSLEISKFSPHNAVEKEEDSPQKIPLTEEQLRLWMFSQKDRKQSIAYNESLIIPLVGHLDIPVMIQAVQKLVERHQALRTGAVDGKYQQVKTEIPVQVPVISFAAGKEYKKDDLVNWLHREINQPFDLADDILFRAHILTSGADLFVLVVVAHHIIVDGWSINVMMKELAELYRAGLTGTAPRLPAPGQFYDYVRWLNNRFQSPLWKESQTFWAHEFSNPVPPLNFAGEALEKEEDTRTGGAKYLFLDASFTTGLKKFSQQQKVTLFMTLLAVFRVFLYRMTLQQQCVIGIPFSGQLQMEVEHLIGQCSTMLPFYSRVPDESPFNDFLTHIKGKVLKIYKHQNLSYNRVIKALNEKKISYYLPEINVVFNMDPSPGAPLTLPGLEIKDDFDMESDQPNKYHLFLDAIEINGGIHIKFQYSPVLFGNDTMDLWPKDFKNILSLVMSHPETPIENIQLHYFSGPINNVMGTPVDIKAVTDTPDQPSVPLKKKKGDMENRIAAICREILKVDAIKTDVNFFEMGGTSLLAIQFIACINLEFDIDLELHEIFAYPTIEQLAAVVRRAEKSENRKIEPGEKQEYYELSPSQQRLWILCNFPESSIAYNECTAHLIRGPLDIEAVRKAFFHVIQRHESLRTTFITVAGNPKQKIHDHLPLDRCFEFVDLSREKNGWLTARTSITGEKEKELDLEKGPLWKGKLFCIEEEKYVFAFIIHHLISDGWSEVILFNEIVNLLRVFQTGGPVRLKPLQLHYRDYAAWQNQQLQGEKLKVHRDYWWKEFSDSDRLPVLDLPAFKPRPPVKTYNGRLLKFSFPEKIKRGFNQIAREKGTSLFTVLLAVLDVLFYKYTGQTDIILGTSLADRGHPQLEDQVGLYINTLAIRTGFAREDTFYSLLSKVHNKVRAAFNHQVYPFERLVDDLNLKRDLSRSPLFDILVEVLNFDSHRLNRRHASPGEPDTEPFEYENRVSIFDLSLAFSESSDLLLLEVQFNSDIFAPRQMIQLSRHFEGLARSICAHPDEAISNSDILLEEERNLIREFNRTDSDLPPYKTVIHLMDETAVKVPHRIAYVFADRHITHQWVKEFSSQFSLFISRISPPWSGTIGILMDRSELMAQCILGVWRCGRAYLPIDPDFPLERIKYMLDDANIRLLLFRKAYIWQANQLQWQCEDLGAVVCVDSDDFWKENEPPKSSMDPALWNYVVERAGDDIEAGMWRDSYTGRPFSREEMNEYVENTFKKLKPILNKNSKVLEIGCASGISMFRLAPLVKRYVGIDLCHPVIQLNKKKIREKGIKNIRLRTLYAHELDKIAERDFDMVIMNSVVQFFKGHNYLRQVIKKIMPLLKDQGVIFFGDIMDQEKKSELIESIEKFPGKNPGSEEKAWTDWSEYLFISRPFFDHLAYDFPMIASVRHSSKHYTIENELTRFRFDTIITIDKSETNHCQLDPGSRRKFQFDRSDWNSFSKKHSIHQAKPGDLAYVIYTSGSTGKPKGVMIEHAGMLNHMMAKIKDLKLDKKSIVAQNASQVFDISVWQLFAALMIGGKTIIYPDELILETHQFISRLMDDQVTILEVVPSHLSVILEFLEPKLRAFRWLRFLVVTGEEVKPSLLNQWFACYKNIKVVNAYGPTEAGDDITHFIMEHPPEGESIPIGKPLQNLKIYITDNKMKWCPLGVKGEICVSGPGVGRGYLNNPELTNQKFLQGGAGGAVFSKRGWHPQPIHGQPDAVLSGTSSQKFAEKTKFNRVLVKSAPPGYRRQKIYRTGDRGCWQEDGQLRFFGRKDLQVKIRGYRVELGEIERQLTHHPQVKEAVVMAREDRTGTKYLCAYLVTEGEADPSEIKDYLQQQLPQYSIPAHFVQLEELPLTPNGKVNRRALPEPGGKKTNQHIPPTNRREILLAEIWSKVLGMKKELISIDADFFELGGHSLRATALVALMHETFDTRIVLSEIFQRPTIRDLSQYIKDSIKEKHISILPVEEKEYYLLSSAQKRLFIIQQMERNTISYNLPRFLLLKGKVDREKLQDALEKMIRRHESLRTSFEIVGRNPVQRIHKNLRCAVEYDEVDEDWGKILETAFVRPFDLGKAPLLRVGLVKIKGKDRYMFMFDMHHIITDGTSQEIFRQELMALYAGKQLPGAGIQYRDFSEWQNSRGKQEAVQEQEKFWTEQFSGTLPLLDLPTDYERPEVQNFEGHWLDFSFDRERTEQLHEIAKGENATLFMILLALINILLARLSRQEDIIMGTPAAGRLHADLQRLIGFFVNTLPIRCYPESQKSFKEFLSEVRETTLQAFENQEYPFEDMVDKVLGQRDSSRNPLFDVLFVYQNAEIFTDQVPEARLQDLEIEHHEYEKKISEFDLYFNVDESDNQLLFSVVYRTRLFKKDTIARFIRYFEDIVQSVLENPDIKLSDIHISHDFYVRELDNPGIDFHF